MVAEALRVFGLDENALVRPLTGGTANVSFVIKGEGRDSQEVDGKQRWIITFCVEPTLARVERLAAVLEHLQEHRFGSNRLLRSPQGCLVHVIDGVPTIVKSFLEGEMLSVVDEARARRIGGVLARLHQLPIPPGFAPNHAMNREIMVSIAAAAKDLDFSGWLAAALEQIPRDWQDLPVGLVHGDLFPDNLIEVEGGALVPIDFEEVCLYPLVFDIGMALAGFANVGCLSPGTAVALLAGYRADRKLNASERAAVPTMVEFAAMATACWRFDLSQRDGPIPGELRNWRDAQATHELSLEWRGQGIWTEMMDA